MQDRMSTEEYRKLVVEPALQEERDDEAFLKNVAKIDKKPRNNEEDELTKKVVNYLEELKMKGKVLCYSHIPSSTYTRSWPVKSRNKAMGVRPGVPDLLIVFPSEVLFLELKREVGGVLSVHQKQWIEDLKSSGKVCVDVAHGWSQAKHAIDFYSQFTS